MSRFESYKKLDDDTLKWLDEEKMLNAADLAREFGVTRMNIRQITMKALGKVFNALKEDDPNASSMEIVLKMCSMFDALNDKEALKVLIGSLPPKIRDDIRDEAQKKFPHMKI